MSRKIKVKFHVRTKIIGSETSETFSMTLEDLYLEEDATRVEIEQAISEFYEDWVWENIESNFSFSEE